MAGESGQRAKETSGIRSEGFYSLFDGDTIEFKVESSSDGRTKAVHVTSSDGASFSRVATT
ncbi:hypothetical protein H5410_026018 [Solanum commersonii]|uniref:Uncharacterized protein n=1 Tax=Solanum commersonii TaxID=4109 RepID=A0A9J5Z087_SOLCO|nr:hypothetical protein H5410_026018 [Solanum commersonii]